jgi:hypothetical protein
MKLGEAIYKAQQEEGGGDDDEGTGGEKGSDDDDIVACRAEYVRLAETLYNGTEPLAPAPLPDREIFELLGFD